MRDYEVIAYVSTDPQPGIAPKTLSFLFKYCVEAHVETAVPRDGWKSSLSDALLDWKTGPDHDGYVWGIRWQNLYPGASLLPESVAASEWEKEIGIGFHEAKFETNGHNLTLVFSDLEVREVKRDAACCGNITDDPELRYTETGAALAGFTVAVSHRSKHNGEWQDVNDGFFRCTVWRSVAENAAQTLKRGMRAFVAGKLVQRNWQDNDGNKRQAVEVQVTHVGPDLQFGTAEVAKSTASLGSSSAGPSAASSADEKQSA